MNETVAARTARVTIAMEGLPSPEGRASAAEYALNGVPGVTFAYVCTATEMAYVTYDPDCCTACDLIRAVEQVGLRADLPMIR
jgi:hypothetical protein